MGFRERDVLIPEVVRDQIAAHGRGRYEGPAGVRLVLVDGVAGGLWERKKRGKRMELRVTPARKLTRAQRARLDEEARRIGAFTGLEPVLTVE
jgi:Winged helix DNA-binding domain